MDTKDLALFLAIAKIKSISKTAEQLFMSQSTVTTRLQRLEKLIGAELFTRTQSGVQLTSDGGRLISLAERMVALEEEMTRPTNEDAPIIKVMSGRAFVSTDVPACLTRMQKLVNVHWQVRMGMYDEMTDALLANQVDFCFLGQPIYHPNIIQEECKPDYIDLVVPKGHFFTHRFEGIQDLVNEPFVAFGKPSSPFRQRILENLAQKNVYPNICMELDSIDGIKAMVSSGLGVSFLPRRTLHDADAKGYVAIPMDHSVWTRPTFIAYPENTRTKPLVQKFLQVVHRYYDELP